MRVEKENEGERKGEKENKTYSVQGEIHLYCLYMYMQSTNGSTLYNAHVLATRMHQD